MSTHSLSDSALLETVKEKSRAFERKIWWRDLRESVAALIVFVAFGWIAWDAGGLVRAGALIVMAGSAFIAWRLYRTRARHDTAAHRSVADRLRAERARVDAQIRLLDTVALWYLAPLTTGMLLIVAGMDGWSWATLGQAAFILAVAAAIYVLNQRAVRTDLQPRREELTEMLERVES